MLEARGLEALLASDDVRDICQVYRNGFRVWVDDPLSPAFKFPLTANEEVRLANKMKLRLARLGKLLDPSAAKVQYGGVTDRLRHKGRFDVASVIERAMAETLFLRSPSYPGIACKFQGRYGSTLAVKGFRYQHGERPRERFQVMKYFHMGHRIENVVLRERELVKSAIAGAAVPSQTR